MTMLSPRLRFEDSGDDKAHSYVSEQLTERGRLHSFAAIRGKYAHVVVQRSQGKKHEAK